MEGMPFSRHTSIKAERGLIFVSYIRNLVCTLLKLVFRLKFVTGQIIYAIDIYVSTFRITTISTYI